MNKQEVQKLIHDLWVQYTENNADTTLVSMYYGDLVELIEDQWVEPENQ